MTRPDESEALERLARAAVLWYWTVAHGGPAVNTPEHYNLWRAIEEVVDASMGLRTWSKVEPAPLDLRRVEVDGHGVWVRVGAQLFRHEGDVYRLRTFQRLRELGAVREVES